MWFRPWGVYSAAPVNDQWPSSQTSTQLWLLYRLLLFGLFWTQQGVPACVQRQKTQQGCGLRGPDSCRAHYWDLVSWIPLQIHVGSRRGPGPDSVNE